MRERLAAWLGRDDLTVEQVSGGSSNLTFRVRTGDDDWILRRPPLSHVLATANDMKREWTVQRALHDSDVPVATIVRTCEDESVLGSPFYLMERLDGIVFNDATSVSHVDEIQSRVCSFELVDVLARLHAVDPVAVGLADFGRPVGFVERQVRRWLTQWDRAGQIDLPEIDEIARRLSGSIPPEGAASIVHGDYSFNNTMFFRDPPTRLQAVLDWEMSTLGDPLTDVGMVVMYWGEMGSLLWQGRDAAQPHRANAGFPTAEDLLERYAAVSGRDLTHIGFYRVLAAFKLAVIVAGNGARTRVTDPEAGARSDRLVRSLAELALDSWQ